MEPGNYALLLNTCLWTFSMMFLDKRTLQMTWPDRWTIALQITKGINHLHTHSKPIIHRDIKSSNVLMTRGDQDFLVKIGIFGLTKVRHETSCHTSYF